MFPSSRAREIQRRQSEVRECTQRVGSIWAPLLDRELSVPIGRQSPLKAYRMKGLGTEKGLGTVKLSIVVMFEINILSPELPATPGRPPTPEVECARPLSWPGGPLYLGQLTSLYQVSQDRV